MLNNLWGEEFKIDTNETQILSKIKNTKASIKTTVTKQKLSLPEKLEAIKTNVYRILGNRVNDIEVIRDRAQFTNYINKALANNLISIDTETNNSLDPLTCKLMGLCLYTPGLKAAYIPVNHINMYTNEKLDNQLTEQDIYEELCRLQNTYIIFHNAKFDYQVLKCTCKVDLNVCWDTMIGAKLINENESARLKDQYILHINPEQEKYSIENLFEKEKYEIFDPDLFALYAATDALITYELYKYQIDILNRLENARVLNLMKTIEVPFIKVVANMELRGIKVDKAYAQRLGIKYHKKLDELQLEINEELNRLKPEINQWRLTKEANEKVEKAGKLQKSKSEQLEDNVNLDSPTQLAILLYDVLKVGTIDKKTPRGTGGEILEKIDIPLCKLLVERKAILKLSKDFIDTLPEKANDIDGRIHCDFNQYGAATGRLSSSNPNLQQIPSHDKSVRMIFTASDGYKLVGSDYSSQEPRITAFMSRDPKMIEAYKTGKDLYAVIAQSIFDNNYEDNLEFYPAGTELDIDGKKVIAGYKTHLNKAGKERRAVGKTLQLAAVYGMSGASAAELMNKPVKEGQELLDSFFKQFHEVKRTIDESKKALHSLGYVEDWAGRRRHIPEINLPPYEVSVSNSEGSYKFNPFLECKNIDLANPKILKWQKEIDNAIAEYQSLRKQWAKKENKTFEPTNEMSNKQYTELAERALKEGIIIKANTGKIAQAERQCFNARIQGGAASLTKLAMVNIDNDKELNDLGFKMLLTIHDEVLGECPAENADKAAARLSKVMIDTAKPFIDVPMVCDAYIVNSWYEDEYSTALQVEYKKYTTTGLTKEEALSKLIENHSEVLPEFITNLIN